MNYNNANVNSNNNNKNNGFSVRCLQDWREKGGEYRPSLFEDLHNAYLDARRNKRKTRNQLTFERNLERELFALETELQNRTYVLCPGICFINEKPVKREIVAADFRDRVIHHLLYNWISPSFDRQFIHDSYIKRDLGIRNYGRYVDDMVLIHSDKQVLLDAIESIRFFLKERLHLILHPRKIRLQPASRGFSFLGAYLLPYRCYPGRRIVKNYRQCLVKPCQDRIFQNQRIQSYQGLLQHFNCRSLLETC
jgi:hypothetical protein